MNLYTCIDHDGHWPVGVASVVLAENENHAIDILDEQLVSHGLLPYEKEHYTLVKVSQTKAVAIILQDGDY